HYLGPRVLELVRAGRVDRRLDRPVAATVLAGFEDHLLRLLRLLRRLAGGGVARQRRARGGGQRQQRRAQPQGDGPESQEVLHLSPCSVEVPGDPPWPLRAPAPRSPAPRLVSSD